jgi:hypothetical protein
MSLSYLQANGTSLDADAVKIALLQAIKLLLDGSATTTDLTETEALLTKAVWTSIPGNLKVFTYYAVPDLINNPSGNTSNVQSIEYQTALGIIFTETISYDINDLVISITCS